jgi:hypothetical protein
LMPGWTFSQLVNLIACQIPLVILIFTGKL